MAILNVFSRTPALLAMSAASLDRVSDGRARLGIGTSHPSTVEGLHGLPFERPVTRIEETVELLARFFDDGGPVSYDGDCFSVDGERFRPLDVDVPVYNAALGTRNRWLTGRLCDGWVPNQIPMGALGDYFETVADGAKAAGRDPDDIHVTPWVPAAVSDDGEVARDAIRECIAFYIGNFKFYRNTVGEAYPESADRIAEIWAEDRSSAADAVGEELVETMGIAGTPDRAHRQLRELAADPLIDVPVLSFPPTADQDLIERTIEVLSPATL